MGEPIKTESGFYAGTFQNMDGSNYTLAGFEQKVKANGKSASAFIGGGTNFKSDDLDLVVDFKGSMNYDANGIVNQNIRLRTKFSENKQTFQVRYSPLTVNVPVGDKTTLYANPHYTGQISTNGKWKHSAGIFAGATQKFGNNTSVSLEVQRYNLQNITDNRGANWGINATLSYKF